MSIDVSPNLIEEISPTQIPKHFNHGGVAEKRKII